MDYRKYECSTGERLWCLAAGGFCAAVISWLLYRSWYAMVLAFPAAWLYRRDYQEKKAQKGRETLLGEFKDAMQAVSAALLAGYSMENAWREAEEELKRLHGETSVMYAELRQINAAVRMSKPLEKGLMQFAERSGCEEIESFAEIFSFAKRSGGDFPGIIQATVRKMAGRMEVEREIAVVVAGKRLEGKIMNVMPVFILAYLNLTSGDFLDVMYEGVPGRVVMSAALIVYLLAVKLSRHILNIRV